jgi:hypothetical protein
VPATLGPALRADLPLPDLIERGQANVLRCPMYEDGALLAPTSSTVTVRSKGGTVLVNAATATITGSVPTYSYTPDSTLVLEDGWVVEWRHTFTTHGVVTVRNDAALCRVRLSCPVTLEAIYQLAPALRPGSAAPITAQTLANHDDVLGDAWGEVQRWLLTQGRRQYLVIGAHALYDLTRYIALERLFRGLAHRSAEAYGPEADRYQKLAEHARTTAALTYDEDDDALPDEGKRGAKSATVWLGSTGIHRARRWAGDL